jgi:hypothetical protein
MTLGVCGNQVVHWTFRENKEKSWAQVPSCHGPGPAARLAAGRAAPGGPAPGGMITDDSVIRVARAPGVTVTVTAAAGRAQRRGGVRPRRTPVTVTAARSP